MHFIQALHAEIIQRDRTIHSLQTELARSKTHKQTQTVGCITNKQHNSHCQTVTRKDNSQLRKRMLKLRRKEIEEAFKEVANLVGGGENGGGGVIP